MAVELYHPELDAHQTVSDAAAVHWIREGGWQKAKKKTTPKVKKVGTADDES